MEESYLPSKNGQTLGTGFGGTLLALLAYFLTYPIELVPLQPDPAITFQLHIPSIIPRV